MKISDENNISIQSSTPKQLFSLLCDEGMQKNIYAENMILLRCNKLGNVVLVSEKHSERIVGSLAYIKRSPTELWGYNFVKNKKVPNNNGALLVWEPFLLNAARNGFYWLTGVFRQTGDDRLERHYQTMGFIPVGKEEYYNPMPLCVYFWDKHKDNFTVQPKHEVEGKIHKFWGSNSLIRIDWNTGIARYYSTKLKKYTDSISFTPSLFNKNIRNKKIELSENLAYSPFDGRIIICSNLFFLSPWWTSISTRNIHQPIMDKWPWEKVEQPLENKIILTQNNDSDINKVELLDLNKKKFVIKIIRGRKNKFVRALFESKNDPIIKNSEICIDKTKISILSTSFYIEKFKWLNDFRIQICSNDTLSLKLERQ